MTGAAPDTAGLAPLILLLIVLVADILLGAMPGFRPLFAAPLAAIRGMTGWFDKRLNRVHRSRAARRGRGLMVVLLVTLLAWAVGAAVHRFAFLLPHGWMLEAAVVLALFGQGDRVGRLRRIAAALAAGKRDEARHLAAPLVRYDVAALDDHGVARAAIEGSVARFTEGCLGTMFWYLLLGLPALCVYRAIGAAAGVIGRSSQRHADFGFVARRLDDIFSLPAAILAGAVLACAALFVPQARPAAAMRVWARDLGERAVRADFRGEGAMAGALGLALGGPRPLDGATLPGGWIGDGRARATVPDIHRAVLIVIVGCLLVAVALALAVILRTGG